MPKNVAQLTGMIVTAIIVFGTDMDVYYAMPFGERYIWGVTAGILRNLYETIYGS